MVCPSPNECQTAVTSGCNPATGKCSALPNKPDGTRCTGGTSRAGVCNNLCTAKQVTCPAPRACQNIGTCNPATGTCSPLTNKPDGTSCTGGACRGGQCADVCRANGVTCPAPGQCQNAGSCDPATGTCSPLTNKPDGTSCAGGACRGGQCTDVCRANGVTCPAPNQCQNAGTCNPATGTCSPLASKPDGTSCPGGACRGGQCVGELKLMLVHC